MLLDKVLPAWDFRDAHTIWVQAPPEHTYVQLMRVTPAETPLFRLLFALRMLPARSARRPVATFDAQRPLYEQFLQAGFTPLAEAPNSELVVGRIAQFWKPWGGSAAPIRDCDEFLAFNGPGYAKAAVNFCVRVQGGRTRLTTETRIRTTDTAARRAFGRYWLLIKPGSAAIRWSWLRAIKRRAEEDYVRLRPSTS